MHQPRGLHLGLFTDNHSGASSSLVPKEDLTSSMHPTRTSRRQGEANDPEDVLEVQECRSHRHPGALF